MRRLRLGTAALAASFVIAIAVVGLTPLQAGAFVPLTVNMRVPLPPDAATGSSASSSLDLLSCPTPDYCVGFGSYTRSGGLSALFRNLLVDGRWGLAVRVAYPHGDDNFLAQSLSCPAIGACTLVGEAATVPLVYRPFTMRESGGTWGALVALSPAPGATTQFLKSVSCPTTRWCEAAGWFTNSAGTWAYTETESGAVWSPPTQFTSPLAPSTQEDGFNSVSCWAATECAAVGWDTTLPIAVSDPTFGGTALGVVMTSGTWGPVTSIAAPPGHSGDKQTLESISCVDPGKCEAVGSENPDVLPQPISGALLGGTWAQLALLSYPGPVTGSYIGQVSCFNSTACMAVGFYSDPEQGMVFSGMVAGTMTESDLLQPVPPVLQFPGAVSCPTDETCIAGGSKRSSLSAPLVAESWSPAVLSIPRLFVALHVGPHAATLSWRAPSLKGDGIAGYTVSEVTKKGLSRIAFVTKRTVTVTGLAAQHKYVFAVVAVAKDKQTSAPVTLAITTT
jgi:hypothetical protein